MDARLFRTILLAFAETSADVDIRPGGAAVQIRDEVFDLKLSYSNDDSQTLLVTENELTGPAREWLLRRVAKLPQLADRLLATCGTAEILKAPFIRPAARLSADLARSVSGETKDIDDAAKSLAEYAGLRSAGATSVLYLTSDAGEGKTTLINRAAYEQAKAYKERRSHTLLVPISLSGKAFLTFDDAVIAALVNKLRFNYLFFDAFLWLVRLGAIVPAFDGYEEMLVEGSKGEAVSALGGLVQSLDSSGSIVIAARKAFFDYLSFKSQARLLDAIGDHSASFSRIELVRWSRGKALEFARASGVSDPEIIYDAIAVRLGPDHPLLTRAVLVTRLFEVAQSAEEGRTLAELLSADPQSFFFTFVDALVAREARDKWLARVAGEIMEPLLSTQEHHDLLSQIAVEMWQSSARYLRFDTLDVVVDLFAEERTKSGFVIRQIKERIRQHSLLATDPSRPMAVSFDHEDFQDFYLGEGLGRLLAAGVRSDLYAMISVNILSQASVVQGVQHVVRTQANLERSLSVIREINAGEAGFSFCKENCSALALRICEFTDEKTENRLGNMYFAIESLSGRVFHSIDFDGCHFQPTSLNNSTLGRANFVDCEFERLDLSLAKGSLDNCSFENCKIDSIYVTDSEEYIFDPSRIRSLLAKAGAIMVAEENSGSGEFVEDERVKLLTRFFRIFMRTTQVNEDVIRLRLGSLATRFFEDVLPSLESNGILSEVTWDGRGVQRRYRLAVPMINVNRAFESGDGTFEDFLQIVRER